MDKSDQRLIAIGGSLGAVRAVSALCAALPRDIPAAVCIVVHVGARGANMLAQIFDDAGSFPIVTASDGQKVESGRGYVAPADRHLVVVDGTLRLGAGPRENLARPAIDPLFRSAGLSYGARAIGVVLTGTLNDGAAGLADLKRCGGVTVVQNPTDAEAPEMPLEALRVSDVDYRAPLSGLAELLATLLGEPTGPGVPCPREVALEVDIALGRATGADEIAQFADPAAISCPACSGVLSQVRRSPLRFRCQVGHGYSAEALAASQEGSVDEALRVALRIVGDRATLTEKMAAEARREGLRFSAHSYEEKAKESRRTLEVLQQAIRKSQGAA